MIEHYQEGNTQWHYVIIDLAADYISGEPTANDDAADARWVSKQELNNLSLSAFTRELLLKKLLWK